MYNIWAHNIGIGWIIETLKEMQNKGLIKKLYRPIEANNIISKTPQSTLSQSKTPPSEENHFITIMHTIILLMIVYKYIPPSLNRSLAATPIVEPNTIPHVFIYW